jgi:hypothetical protein
MPTFASMVIENDIPLLGDWLPGACLIWLLVVLLIAAIGVGASVLFAVIGRGPGPGWRTVRQRLAEGTRDLLAISPRRIYALSKLSVQEAIRKRVYVAFALFVLVLLFASLFRTPDGNQPARMYLDFVLFWAMTVPLLLVALFLSSFSLPGDIASRTIHTVVTKPVRPTEIVLGRIFGFTAIGSMMLLPMGLISYFFVARTLAHRHEIVGPGLTREVIAADEGDRVVFRGTTTAAQNHAHRFEIDIAHGEGRTELAREHWHEIVEAVPDRPKSGTITRLEPYRDGGAGAPAAKSGAAAATPGSAQKGPRIRVISPDHGLADGDIVRISDVKGTVEAKDTCWVVENRQDDSFVLKDSQFSNAYEGGGQWRTVRYVVGPAQDYIRARVPVLAATLNFRERDGSPKNTGINVGLEWGYRSHVQGGTLSAAIYRFQGLTPNILSEVSQSGLRLQMQLSVFRIHKGNIEKGVGGAVQLINPKTGFKSTKIPFTSEEFKTMEVVIPGKIQGTLPGSDVVTDGTIFDDYVADSIEMPLPTGKPKKLDNVLDLEITCSDPGQFLGMAKHDVYFLADQASPSFNFIKGCLSVWLQMVLVTSFGVVFSTFLNGFVALLTTAAMTVGSFQMDFIRQILNPDNPGGLAIESLFRVVTRAPITTDLDPTLGTDIIAWLDSGVWAFLRLMSQMLPDMAALSNATYVSQGFNVPGNNLCIQFLTVLGFFVPLCLIGHYILKAREVAG